jgi:hypothetical protein
MILKLLICSFNMPSATWYITCMYICLSVCHQASKRSPDQVQGFDDDLKAFVERIRKRADDKIANNEVSPLADDPNEGANSEDEYEPAPVSCVFCLPLHCNSAVM